MAAKRTVAKNWDDLMELVSVQSENWVDGGLAGESAKIGLSDDLIYFMWMKCGEMGLANTEPEVSNVLGFYKLSAQSTLGDLDRLTTMISRILGYLEIGLRYCPAGTVPEGEVWKLSPMSDGEISLLKTSPEGSFFELVHRVHW